jgi:hypothetical protein
MIEQYLLTLRKTPLDDHTEMTGRAALEALLNAMIATHGPKGAIATVAPAKNIRGHQ